MERKKRSILAVFARAAAVPVIAVAVTAAIFLFLPVMQTIGRPEPRDYMVRDVGVAQIEPPPPIQEPEEEPDEEEPPEEPPRLEEEVAPVDLAQLELALNPGFGGGGGDFTINLGSQLAATSDEEALDQIFSLADLDQRPRVIFQRTPTYPPELRKQKRQGTVNVLFMVDTRGRVMNPVVENSTDPAFERPALEAVRQWKFEPGTRNGEKVPFKLRVPITFNAAT